MTTFSQNEVISVILPVYNAERWIAACIQSLINQSFKDFIIHVINDGSNDQTLTVLNSYSDPRIVIHNNVVNKGLIFSLNFGLSVARGRYIARMDADDICLPSRFEEQINYMEQHPEVCVLGTRAFYLDDESEVVFNIPYPSNSNVGHHLLYRNCIIHPSVMIRRSMLGNVEYNQLALGYEDYDLWLRLHSWGAKFSILPKPLLYYRLRTGSESNLRPYKREGTQREQFLLTLFNVLVKIYRLVPLETILYRGKHERFLSTYIREFQPSISMYYRGLLSKFRKVLR